MEFTEDLAWTDEAWDAYQAAPGDLHRALNATLSRIGLHPDSNDVRRRRMQNPPLYVVAVPGPDDWVVMWRPGAEVPEIHYVGPDPL